MLSKISDIAESFQRRRDPLRFLSVMARRNAAPRWLGERIMRIKFCFGIGVIFLGLTTIKMAHEFIGRAAEWRGPETVLFGLGIIVLGVVTCRNARKDLPKPRQHEGGAVVCIPDKP